MTQTLPFYSYVYTPHIKRKYVKKVRPCINIGKKYHVNGDSKTGGFFMMGLIVIPCSKCNAEEWLKICNRGLSKGVI